jgi:hypothetical protein
VISIDPWELYVFLDTSAQAAQGIPGRPIPAVAGAYSGRDPEGNRYGEDRLAPTWHTLRLRRLLLSNIHSLSRSGVGSAPGAFGARINSAQNVSAGLAAVFTANRFWQRTFLLRTSVFSSTPDVAKKQVR